MGESHNVMEAADFLWLMVRQTEIELRGAGDLPNAPIDGLRRSFEEISFAYTRTDPNRRLVAATEAPGYLTAKLGGRQVFVPWPLVESFPDDEILSELIEIAGCVCIQPDDILCISGSATMLGHQIAIGDLDFCQYVTAAPVDIVGRATSFQTPDCLRALVEARYGDDNPVVATAPWETNWGDLEKAMAEANMETAERFMTEFLACSGRFGLIPASNVVLPSDLSDRRRGAAARSFAFQEAVVMTNNTRSQSFPPWPLVDVSQLAMYLNLLRQHIEYYYDRDPIKAVKRALSFARTVRLHDWADRALELLSSQSAVRYVEESRSREVQKRSARLDPESMAFISRCDSNLLTSPLVGDASNENPPVGAMCQKFLEELQLEITRLEASLDTSDIGEAQ
jgi:hypothetical protein